VRREGGGGVRLEGGGGVREAETLGRRVNYEEIKLVKSWGNIKP
jgi:hypothetical protein